MSSLNQRLLSAIALVAIVAISFQFLGELAVFVLIYFAISISQYEYLTLALSDARRTLKIGFFFLVQYYLLHCLAISLFPTIGPIKLAIQFFVFICFFGLLSEKENISEILNDIYATCFGFIYLGVLPGLLVLTLQNNPDHMVPLFLFLLLCVFSGDVFAYFVGLKFGKKKVLPLVSPKKTIAGCIGGLTGSVVLGSAFYYYFMPNFHYGIPAICALMGVYAQTGDFLESLIKRINGKKDSGKLLPGHGGFLDRIDGVLFAIPALYFFFF